MLKTFFKVEKSLAGRLTNEKWLNVLDEILTAAEKENRSAKIYSIDLFYHQPRKMLIRNAQNVKFFCNMNCYSLVIILIHNSHNLDNSN